MTPTILLSRAALGFRVTRRGQTTVTLSICRVAELGGSPHQLTSNQTLDQGPDVVGEQRNDQILVNLCYVPRGTSSEAETDQL